MQDHHWPCIFCYTATFTSFARADCKSGVCLLGQLMTTSLFFGRSYMTGWAKEMVKTGLIRKKNWKKQLGRSFQLSILVS